MMPDKSEFNMKVLTPEMMRERAADYSRSAEDIQIKGELKEFLSFRLGEEWCLFEMAFVHEVVCPTRISRLPRQPKYLRGTMNVRGAIVLVIDLEKIFNRPEIELTESSRVVLLRHNEKVTGVIVDQVERTLQLDTGICQSSLSTLKGIEAEFITGLFVDNHMHSIWLNADRILTEVGIQLTA